MDDEGEYADAEIVWVKLSYCWWPAEVIGGDRLTDEFTSTLKKRPLAVVKFFEEDSYEYVKNTNFIYKYNCNRKHEFLRKGLEQYRAQNKHMEKFPADVMHAERATGGDPNIVNSRDFLPHKRESYADLFQPDKLKGKTKITTTPRPVKKASPASKIIPVIPVRKHEVRILAQSSTPAGICIGNRGVLSTISSTPRSTDSIASHSPDTLDTPTSGDSASPLKKSSPASQLYHCYKCGFESGRQNVIVLHTKHCRAIPSMQLNIPSIKASKLIQSIEDKLKKEEISTEQTVPVDSTAPTLCHETPSTLTAMSASVDKTVVKTEIEDTIAKADPTEAIIVKEQSTNVADTSDTVPAAFSPKLEQQPEQQSSPTTPIPTSHTHEKVDILPSNKLETKRATRKTELEELIEVIQIVDPKPTRSRASRTPRESAAPRPPAILKPDRRRTRGRGKLAVTEETEKKDSIVETTLDGEKQISTPESEQDENKTGTSSTSDKDLKGKPDVELKNELLADWSEDEPEEPDAEVEKEQEDLKLDQPAEDADKTDIVEKPSPSATSTPDLALDKSSEMSPQLSSPVSSGTTIKYRNIPKKQKREFIEVTNDQPILSASAIEKSSSESSISTAATCGDTLSVPDKTSSSSESQSERPISAKQRILGRATRGSSKSASSDEVKIESPSKTAIVESQPNLAELSKKETSCFDFKEEEEEEIILNKSPRRSLSNRRETSLEINTSSADANKEQECVERAKKDAVLKNEIDTLLNEVSLPRLPDVPKAARVPSPSPSQSSTETTPQSKEEIDQNRTLPPKERGKRIFKTRNKVIENEAIALEQSKAIVLDFVKKSHEEELAELREQQEAEGKVAESPTTTNDDSQESVTSNEPPRFENSEFAAIKAKRAKFPPAEKQDSPISNKDISQESAVSSSNENKVAPTADLLLTVVTKEQPATEELEKRSTSVTPSPKTGKKKQRKLGTPTETAEKASQETEGEAVSSLIPSVVEETTPRPRKKKMNELQSLETVALDTPRLRRSKAVKYEEPVSALEDVKLSEVVEPVSPVATEKPRKQKRVKKEDNLEVIQPHNVEEVAPENQSVPESEDKLPTEPRTPKSKRTKHAQQRSADSTAELSEETPNTTLPSPVVDKDNHCPADTEALPTLKQQPIKMIIKSKGKKSNSELICEPMVVLPETKEEAIKEKLLKSPKSSKRKKRSSDEMINIAETSVVVAGNDPSASIKTIKTKRSKVRSELHKIDNEVTITLPIIETNRFSSPSATDLQIAEALINLPEIAPVMPLTADIPEKLEEKAENASPVSTPVLSGLVTKIINPRKRHLLTNTAEPVDLPTPNENLAIPEKKKRETSAAAVTAALLPLADTASDTKPLPTDDDDKFDIDNIPIVLGDNEILDDSTITTTTNAGSSQPDSPKPKPSNDEEDYSKSISPTRPMTKKIVIVKNSNGSAKIVGSKETQLEVTPPIPKINLGIKNTTITIKPTAEQLLSKPVQSPTHSPPIRSTQLVQASSGGQIVITSKGTVLTTQSHATSSAKTVQKALITPSTPKSPIVSSVSTVSPIISSTSKSVPVSPSITSPRSSAGVPPIKSPSKICVQSQEIIHPPLKQRSFKAAELHPVQKSETSPKKSSSTMVPKKILLKKISESASTRDKPLFATSKGAPITPQLATSSAIGAGKKGHRVIKISPQKLKEFTRLGMVEDKGQGKVLTASGMRKFRQEQQMLQQQQQQQKQKIPRSAAHKKITRQNSVDEEPSTSTPTPPPPAETTTEVVVAAAADSSVKEIPSVVSSEVEESLEVRQAASSTDSPGKPASPAQIPVEPPTKDENEADAAEKTPEPESSISKKPSKTTVPLTNLSTESIGPTPAVAVETTAEAVEPSSNVQESSQLIAVPAENFGGPANLFYLCSVREEGFVPVNNELLYLDSSNQLVALPEQASVEDIEQAEVLEIPAGSEQATVVTATAGDIENADVGQQNILLNTQDGQQIILDQQSLMALAAGGDTSQLLTPDGQQILLQGSAQELLAALAVSQPGLGIVAAEGTQIIVAQESLIDLQDAPLPGEIIQVNPNTTVETNAVLTKPPIMSVVEVPTKNGNASEGYAHSPEQKPLETAPTNLDESLAAVIGVQSNPNVPTSLELPITVTNPVIAKTTTSKINPIYPPTTAISTIGIDPTEAATAIIDLPTITQTGTDSSQVETHDTSSNSERHCDKINQLNNEKELLKVTETNGKNIDENDENQEVQGENAENDLDEIIPNTPESQMNSHAEISSQFSDDESEAPVPIPSVDEEEDDDNASNCSEIIPIQPNVVILRNINNELINNNDNDNSSDMEIDNTNPTSGNGENNPNPTSNAEVTVFDATNNSSVVER